MGETNFTLGPISKSILFCFYNGFYNCLLSPRIWGVRATFKAVLRAVDMKQALQSPAMRISCDDNIVIQLSYLFQNIVKISLSSKFWRYHTIFNYEILAYFSLTWTCESKINCIISYGLTCISKNWCILCNCYAFNVSNDNIRAFLPIVASRRNALLEKAQFFHKNCACKISCDIV